ncbi:MAG: chromosome segregation protein SMC, partial [Brevundimonas sp.]
MGFEAARAAALGDDLDAALNARAAAHWAGANPPPPPVWPAGVTPLAAHVRAPTQLAARLALCGLAPRGEIAALARALPVGARLVTCEGDLHRWDGYVARADAPRPAAIRLAQRSRLSELESDIDAARPGLKAAQAALKTAGEALTEADAALGAARRGPPEAERAVASARDRYEALAREQARREARATALDETLTRLRVERDEARQAVSAAGAEGTEEADLPALKTALEAARAAAGAARQTAAAARAERDGEQREQIQREQRRHGLERARQSWVTRGEVSRARVATLETEMTAARTRLEDTAARPHALAAQRETLMDALIAAEMRRKAAGDTLARVEAEAAEADRTARAAEAEAARARETRAGLAAQTEAAAEKREEAERQVRETSGLSPEALGRKLSDDAVARPPDAAGAENLLYGLEREREHLGAVNLRAEEEAVEYATRLETMRGERADLSTAIARLRDGIDELNTEGRERLVAAFDVINDNFKSLFEALFDGGQAELKLVESDDPLEAGLESF